MTQTSVKALISILPLESESNLLFFNSKLKYHIQDYYYFLTFKKILTRVFMFIDV